MCYGVLDNVVWCLGTLRTSENYYVFHTRSVVSGKEITQMNPVRQHYLPDLLLASTLQVEQRSGL